ncbi:MAG: GDP-mannose 4,6-dehydratase [Candidatus Brocadia sp.]|nr:GDP-mannose 4,6-dehydratase [Candidatus Brocadia sp.]
MSDCAAAILRILENGKIGEIYNIGSGNERKNIAVVKTILDILGKPHTLIDFVQDRLGHDMRYSLNYTKLQKDLSWTPKIDFDTGIQETVIWYRNNSEWLEEKVDYLRKYWKKVYRK